MPRQGACTGLHRFVKATSHYTEASRYRAAWPRWPAPLTCSDSSDHVGPCGYRNCNHIALPGCRRGASVTPAGYKSTPRMLVVLGWIFHASHIVDATNVVHCVAANMHCHTTRRPCISSVIRQQAAPEDK